MMTKTKATSPLLSRLVWMTITISLELCFSSCIYCLLPACKSFSFDLVRSLRV